MYVEFMQHKKVSLQVYCAKNRMLKLDFGVEGFSVHTDLKSPIKIKYKPTTQIDIIYTHDFKTLI